MLPCYQTHSISFISTFSHFVFFNFYYIITEHSHLRTLSFYFKIYYLKNISKNPTRQKTEQTRQLVFSSSTKNRTSTHIISENQMSIHIISVSFIKTHHLKQCITKKRPLPEASSLIFVLNLTLQFIYSTPDSQSSHPHRLA